MLAFRKAQLHSQCTNIELKLKFMFIYFYFYLYSFLLLLLLLQRDRNSASKLQKERVLKFVFYFSFSCFVFGCFCFTLLKWEQSRNKVVQIFTGERVLVILTFSHFYIKCKINLYGTILSPLTVSNCSLTKGLTLTSTSEHLLIIVF